MSRQLIERPVHSGIRPKVCALLFRIRVKTRFFFFFSSRRRHTRFDCDWSSDVCSSDLEVELLVMRGRIRKWLYPKAIFQLRKRLQQDSFDLVHAHFGYVGIVARTQWKDRKSVV